jgi:oligopeptide transport system substrate-binding protein
MLDLNIEAQGTPKMICKKSAPSLSVLALSSLFMALFLFGHSAIAADELMVFHRGNISEPGSVDPHQASSTWENNIVGELFMGLTTDDIAGQPIPGAAESWTVSEDGLTWTFHLRPGALWSDGVPVKASDVVFGFQRLLDPKTGARYAFIAYAVKNAAEVNKGDLPKERVGVRAIDDLTVEITLREPTPYLPGLLTHYTTFPLPEHAIRKFGGDWVKPGNLVSNGPYTLESWAANDHIKTAKNPLFYDAENVAIDEVYFYPTDDQSSALNRFRAGEIDANLGSLGFPSSQIEWLKENMPDQYYITPQLANGYIALNLRKPPFSDQRIRRAFSMCVDRKTLAEKVARDGRIPAYSFVPPGTANYENVSPRSDFADWSMEKRRKEAKQLMGDSGFDTDNPLIFEYLYMNAGAETRRAAAVLAAMLKQCNMIMRTISHDARIHYDMVQGGDFTAALAAWAADYDDPHTFLYLIDSRAGVYNYGGYNNPGYDRLMDQAAGILDIDERAKVLARAEQNALDDIAVVPMSFRTSKMLVGPHVKGYVPNANMYHRSRWMRIER